MLFFTFQLLSNREIFWLIMSVESVEKDLRKVHHNRFNVRWRICLFICLTNFVWRWQEIVPAKTSYKVQKWSSNWFLLAYGDTLRLRSQSSHCNFGLQRVKNVERILQQSVKIIRLEDKMSKKMSRQKWKQEKRTIKIVWLKVKRRNSFQIKFLVTLGNVTSFRPLSEVSRDFDKQNNFFLIFESKI